VSGAKPFTSREAARTRNAKIVRLFHHDGLTKSELAQRFGLDQATIHGILKKHQAPAHQPDRR